MEAFHKTYFIKRGAETMTEQEKMKQGLLYDANYDAEILAAQLVAQELCFTYNHTRPSDETARRAILEQLLGGLGKRCVIVSPFHCDYGDQITVGENFYCNSNCVILDGGSVTFGNDVFIAPGCGFYTAGHPENAPQRNAGLEYAKPIRVGNNVWFGAHVAVMPGVTIGDGAVIGAGSVVTRDIPAGMLAYGNPCRPIRPVSADR